MVVDGGLGGLDGGFEERVGITGEFEYHLDFHAVDGGLVGDHSALYEVFLRAGIRHRCQGIHNEFRIECHCFFVILRAKIRLSEHNAK